MLEKDDRPQIERDRGTGDSALDMDINRLIECQARMSTILDLVNAYTSFIHLAPCKNPYDAFRKLGHVNLTDASDLREPVPVDHLGRVEEGDVISVSVKGHFHTLASVDRFEAGDALLCALSPLHR